MMKYFCYPLLLLLLSGMCSCSSKKQLLRQVKKEDRFVKKMERKELQWNLKSYKKAYRGWYKHQPKEVQKRLKEQKKQTKQFYKPYGKPKCSNDQPMPRSKYKKHGLQK